MKIGSSFTSPSPAIEERQGAAVRGTDASKSSRPASGDAVSLSSAAASMSGLDAGVGDFDATKVEAIRQAIREGRFTVNAEAIADRLIAEATALLGPRSH